jgi:hypothetical protein
MISYMAASPPRTHRNTHWLAPTITTKINKCKLSFALCITSPTCKLPHGYGNLSVTPPPPHTHTPADSSSSADSKALRSSSVGAGAGRASTPPSSAVGAVPPLPSPLSSQPTNEPASNASCVAAATCACDSEGGGCEVCGIGRNPMFRAVNVLRNVHADHH